MPEQLFTLAMIVKNEEDVIVRCLSSFYNHAPLAGLVMIDTGSTDSTISKVLDWVNEHHLPYTIKQTPFENFVVNKNEVLDLVPTDWVIWADADEILEKFSIPNLDHDVYYGQMLGDNVYYKPRAFRSRFRFDGPGTHEYLQHFEEGVRVDYTSEIQVQEKPNPKKNWSEKFSRDIQILSKRLEVAPGDSRAVFYLAESLRLAGESSKAVDAYERYLRLEHQFRDEAYWARLMLFYLTGNNSHLLEAMSIDETRNEAVYLMAEEAFRQKSYEAARNLAERCLDTPTIPSHVIGFTMAKTYGDAELVHELLKKIDSLELGEKSPPVLINKTPVSKITPPAHNEHSNPVVSYIKHPNLVFDHVYVLNLRRRKDRLEEVQKKLKKFNITHEVFPAVDGRALRTKYLATTVSHLSIYLDALDRGFSRILILEDDVSINRGFIDLFHHAFNDLEKYRDWGLLYLGHATVDSQQSLIIDRPVASMWLETKDSWGGWAYGITNSVMSHIMYGTDWTNYTEIDKLLLEEIQRKSDFAVYRAIPQLFHVTDSWSDNLKDSQAHIKDQFLHPIARKEDYL